MNQASNKSQIKIDPNKSIFDKIPVKSNYTSVGESFGQWLIRQRRVLDLNQTEFAKRAQLHKATLSLYENDKVEQPRIPQLNKIARALGKQLEEVKQVAAGYAHDETETPGFFTGYYGLPPERQRIARIQIKGIIDGLAEEGQDTNYD